VGVGSSRGSFDAPIIVNCAGTFAGRIEGMEEASLHSTHVGRDGITPDQKAVIDQAGPDGFYVPCIAIGYFEKHSQSMGGGPWSTARLCK
jgi:hypothetical protein